MKNWKFILLLIPIWILSVWVGCLVYNKLEDDKKIKESFKTGFFVGAYSYHLRFDNKADITQYNFLKFTNEMGELNWQSFQNLYK